MGLQSGPVLANSDRFYIDIVGKGGHGGSPDSAIDPIVAAANLIVSLQSIVSRNVSPLDSGRPTRVPISLTQSAVISVTKVEAGTTGNVIPGEAHLAYASKLSNFPNIL